MDVHFLQNLRTRIAPGTLLLGVIAFRVRQLAAVRSPLWPEQGRLCKTSTALRALYCRCACSGCLTHRSVQATPFRVPRSLWRFVWHGRDRVSVPHVAEVALYVWLACSGVLAHLRLSAGLSRVQRSLSKWSGLWFVLQRRTLWSSLAGAMRRASRSCFCCWDVSCELMLNMFGLVC